MKILISICFIFITLIYANNKIEATINMVVQGWNEANNEKDTDMLSRLYAPKVTYYGSKFSRSKCIKDKNRFFKKYPHFSQSINNISYISLTPRLHKVSFDKYVQIKPHKQSKMYPSYLLVDTSSSFPAITEEGDAVTDKNLKRKSTPQTFTFNGIHQIRGTIKKVKHYGPPGFGENPQEDRLLTAYILKLNKPIKVIESNPNELNYTTTATEIHLVAFDFLSQLDVAEKQHKQVILNGEFFSSHTGYHIRELLMDVKSIKF